MTTAIAAPADTRGRVLFIDDDDSVRRMTARLLRRAGFAVADFASARAALDYLATEEDEFDVLLTDAVMPEMTGTEAAERVAVLRPDIAVIFVSGHDSSAIGTDVLARPGRWFLPKPFRSEDLARQLDACLVLKEKGR